MSRNGIGDTTFILAAHGVRVLQAIHPRSKKRAQGRPGARRTHGPRAEKKHAAEPQVRAGTTGLPCAMVLRLIRDLPGDQALLPPSPIDRSTDLAPALGRQDHTISPSATCCSSRNTSRPSHPASNVRDDREAPLLRQRDAREDRFDLPDNARGNVHDGQFAHGPMHAALSASLRAQAKQSRMHPQR